MHEAIGAPMKGGDEWNIDDGPIIVAANESLMIGVWLRTTLESVPVD